MLRSDSDPRMVHPTTRKGNLLQIFISLFPSRFASRRPRNTYKFLLVSAALAKYQLCTQISLPNDPRLSQRCAASLRVFDKSMRQGQRV